jgi:hypothetical protein
MIKTKIFVIANICWALVAVGIYFSGRSKEPAVEQKEVTSALLPKAGVNGNAVEMGDVDESQWSVGLKAGKVNEDLMGKLLKRAFAEKNPILRSQMFANLLANLTAENVEAALAVFESEPDADERGDIFRDFLYAWALIDGEKAVAYALNPDSVKKTWYGSVNAIRGWASKDVAAAKAFVAEREPGDQTAWLHYGVFRTMLDADVLAAAEYAKTNTKSDARGRAMDRLTEGLYKEGGTAALQKWFDGIDTNGENDMLSYKTGAIRSMIDRLSNDDPDMAKALIAENYGQPFVNFETLRHTAWKLGGGDQGMDWLASLPKSKDSSRAFGEMVEHYANRDPNVVAKWLNDRPDSPEFDSAASIFSQQIVDDDPVSAVQWAQSIQAEGQRDKALKKVFKSWQKVDPAAANTWLEQNS